MDCDDLDGGAPAGPGPAGTADTMLRLQRFLPYRLSVVSNAISEAIAQVYRDQYGLSMTEWRLLAVLAEHPGQSAQQLVQLTRLDKVSISRALRRMLEAGLVQRRVDRSDRRRLPLLLSSAGTALYQRIAPAVVAREQQILGCLQQADLQLLHQLLDQLETRFC